MLSKATDVSGSDSFSFTDIDHGSNNSGIVLDHESVGYDSEPSGRNLNTENLQKDYQDTKFPTSLEESEGMLVLHN